MTFGCRPENASNQKSGDPNKALKSYIPEDGGIYFNDITLPAGIDFRHSYGDDHLNNLVESDGGGAAFLDYDQDGFIDLFMTTGINDKRVSKDHAPDGKLMNRLFRNLGDGSFSDVTRAAKLNTQGYAMGVAVGDYDNDSYPDIYICNFGINTLYHNNGNGTFSDETKTSGTGGNELSIAAVWFDYDNDGLLDLYVGNYIDFDVDYALYYAPDGFPGPLAYNGQADRLYHNLGKGQFKDVTEAMGVYQPLGRAMGVAAVDYDADGFTDIYISNDHMVNYLYHNEGGKGFKDVAVMAGVAANAMGDATTSMAVDFGDFNGDGLQDIFVSDDNYCSLYKNDGTGTFRDFANISGIAQASGQHVGWASSFFDYDNDGDEDLFKVNGELHHEFGEEDQLFENDGTGNFKDVSVQHGEYFQKEYVGRGACFGDYDNDGDIDAYIANLNSPGILIRNDGGNRNNWLIIELEGSRSNRDGVGTKVKVSASGKDRYAVKESASGYLSQNDHRLHFGLGNSEIIERIEVKWPSGELQVLENVAVNRILKIKES
ncbi:MAG TPA: CRTAC1 family protein [Cyclobacteriaceae bacterium]|nr:CRTAC1 family protein [Cyclobacteriaceae bacterium]